MKKLLLAIALLLPIAAYADRVKADKAQEIAEKFMNPGGTKAGGKTLSLVWRGEKPGESVSADPAFYVFNADGGGFVVVSGEDALIPILAYSKTNPFPAADNMAPGLADWMEDLQASIALAREKGIKATAAVREAWASAGAPGPARDADEVTIETALWNQDDPYDRLCPEVEGGRSKTGCVATAISIIMYHYKHPVKGKGTLPSYSYTYYKNGTEKTRKQDGKKLGNEYDWDNMLPEYKKGQFTDEQANAVAELMFDVGIMAQMAYHPNGSYAYTSWSARQLPVYMGFDKSLYSVTKSYIPVEDWIAMISEEIDEGRLVLYSGRDNSEGHAFVCDGYRKSDNYLRFNWGWSGSGNGFYALNDMMGFTVRNEATFNIIPDAGGEEPKGTAGYTSITTKEKTITRGEPFTVTLNSVVCQGGSLDKLYIALAKFSSDGQFQEIPSNAGPATIDVDHYYPTFDFDVTIDTDILPGDYLRPICTYGDITDDQPDEWNLLLWDSEGGGQEKLILMDEDSLLASTRFHFDSASRVITVSTLADAACTLQDAKGKDWSSSVKGSGGTFTVDTTALEHGTYTFTVRVNGVSRSFDVVL